MADKRARDRRADAKRRAEKPWRAWYRTKRWTERRREQLRKQPLCERCLKGKPVRFTPATVAHHKVRHQGDPVKFWRGELESVCAACHDSIEQGREARGYESTVDSSGNPVDALHPFYR